MLYLLECIPMRKRTRLRRSKRQHQEQGHESIIPISDQTPRVQHPTPDISREVTPQNALQLQRTLGNRAVTQMIQRQQRPQANIQRTFTDGATFLGNTDGTNQMLQAIAGFMDQYNLFLANNNKQATDYGDAAKTLRKLDRKIFEYFDHHNATTQKIENIPHYTHIEAVRTQANKEHEDFVQSTQDNEGMLPFDFEGMDMSESVRLIMLWNNIRQGMGKIKVSGDPDYQKKVYSWLVKLLETPTGRKILSKLNVGDPNELMTNIYIGEKKSELPLGVEDQAKQKGKTIEDVDRSEAQPLGNTGEMTGPEAPTGDENPYEFPTINSSDGFREAILSGAKGVILSGKKYTFNTVSEKRVGAFVTAKEGESKSEGTNHNQILTPSWVTLGHELGHAVHFRGGGTNMENPQIMQDLTGKSRPELNQIWQNSEELLTIQGWENALRGDVGLSQRGSHVPYTAGKRIERYWSIFADFKQTYADLSYITLFNDLGQFKRDMNTTFNMKDEGTGFDDDNVYQALQLRWQNLKNKYDSDDLKLAKRAYVLGKYNQMVETYTTKLQVYNDKFWKPTSKKEEWATLKQKYLLLKDKWENHYHELMAEETDTREGGTTKFYQYYEAVDLHQWKLSKFAF